MLNFSQLQFFNYCCVVNVEKAPFFKGQESAMSTVMHALPVCQLEDKTITTSIPHTDMTVEILFTKTKLKLKCLIQFFKMKQEKTA